MFYCFISGSSPPKMPLCVAVSGHLTVAVHLNGVLMSSQVYHHLLSKNNKMVSETELSNILAFVKSQMESSFSVSDVSDLHKVTVSFLERALEDEDIVSADNQCAYLLSFVCEQLRLLQVSKYERQYSAN